LTASAFEHPFLAGLLGDEEIASYFTAAAEIEALLAFETALAEAEAEEGIVTREAAGAIRERVRDFAPDLAGLGEGTARDGVVVPALLQQLRQGLDAATADALHRGATSQDAIDAAMAMRLQGVSLVIDRRLARLGDRLAQWGIEAGGAGVMAHTRMHAARPTLFRRKLSAWADPLVRCRLRREEIAPRAFALRFGGAVGDRAELGERGDAVAGRVAASLGLFAAPGALHSERDGIADLGHWLSLVTGALGKFGQDVVLALQSEVGELRLEGGGTSSAMAHKQNPVGAEMLVTLARFNATLVSGLHHSLVHENERSGAAWTLEWMLLPQMAMAAGAATRIAEELLEKLSLAKV
jgi:3-carboxy-cis,cis-muconate cycloisomerase